MYLDQTKKSAIVRISNEQIIDMDEPGHKYEIVFELSNIRFTSHDMQTGTDEVYAIKCEATAFYDNDDGRAVRVLVKNGKSETFYTE